MNNRFSYLIEGTTTKTTSSTEASTRNNTAS